jgi:hypothetical protein
MLTLIVPALLSEIGSEVYLNAALSVHHPDGGRVQENDCPQPQLRSALGFVTANPAPWRPSL